MTKIAYVVVNAPPSSPSSLLCLRHCFVSPQGIFDLMICCFDFILELIEGLEQSISDTHNSMKLSSAVYISNNCNLLCSDSDFNVDDISKLL